jgi:hypothetical protein
MKNSHYRILTRLEIRGKEYRHDHCSKLKLPKEINPNPTHCTSNVCSGTNLLALGGRIYLSTWQV